MNEWHIIGLLVIGVGLVVGSILLRAVGQGKYQIKTIDLVFIIVPLVLVGLATGKVRGLDLFGVKMDLSELLSRAAATPIEEQLGRVSVEGVVDLTPAPAKEGTGQLEGFVKQKTQALAFFLGSEGYRATAIKKYLTTLHDSSYLRYVVINHPGGRLYGMYDAADLIAYLGAPDKSHYAEFEKMLRKGDESGLAELPGFVSANKAVTLQTSKRAALQAMEEFMLSSLPVRDSDERFVGTVERARLTTSLILEVTKESSGEHSGGR